jgi:SAM-dependent methyltransferase
MADDSDPQMALMFSFYEGVVRKGPGSEASTLKALSMLDGLPPTPRIVDFGCGGGAAALVLARATQGIVTAVDIHQPFLQQLEALAASEGLTDGIRTVEADMADPPFPDGSFEDSLELLKNSGLPSEALIEVGFEHRLADEESLATMVRACERYLTSIHLRNGTVTAYTPGR